MKKRLLAACAVLLLNVDPAGAAPPPSGAEELWRKLGARLDHTAEALDGVLGVAVIDLTTGARLERRAGQPFPTASTIKPAVLYELYRQAAEKRIDLQEVATFEGPHAGSAGVLQFLGPRARLSWRDLAVLMVTLSDNAATNALIDRLGREAVNARLDGLGLTHTRLRRRMMDTEAARRGEENVATPAELATLMTVLHEGRRLPPELARDLWSVASLPAVHASPFRAGLPEGTEAAVKEGDLEAVRASVAVVRLPGRPYAAAVMTSFLARDAEGERVITEASAAIWQTMRRLAVSSDLGRVRP